MQDMILTQVQVGCQVLNKYGKDSKIQLKAKVLLWFGLKGLGSKLFQKNWIMFFKLIFKAI